MVSRGARLVPEGTADTELPPNLRVPAPTWISPSKTTRTSSSSQVYSDWFEKESGPSWISWPYEGVSIISDNDNSLYKTSESHSGELWRSNRENSLLYLKTCLFQTKCVNLAQKKKHRIIPTRWPLPVPSEVITSISEVITPVTHLFLAI